MQDKEQKSQKTEEHRSPITGPTENASEENRIRPPQSPETVSQKDPEESTSEPGVSMALEDGGNPAAANKTDGIVEERNTSHTETPKDLGHTQKQTAPIPDYQSMSMENLLSELQRLVTKEDISAIGKPVSAIKHAFDQKFQALIAQKKEEFVAGGGEEVHFQYNSDVKKEFDTAFATYCKKQEQYYQQREQTLKSNLQKRLAIIEELKGLMKVEETIHTTYKTFKALQEDWRKVGPIPRNHYNDVWRTYHHHVEIFYDFLQLNRELRDLDFKHNLEEKQKLIVRAEALAREPDLYKAFGELQVLHKIWKEEVGPVAKEHREGVWERFSKATKVIHQRRQAYFQELEKDYEKNLEKKEQIIASLRTLADHVADNHKALLQQTEQVEALREAFFNTGKVPQKLREQTWTAFKEAIRKFNGHKNTFYKAWKKEQHQNLERKKALLEVVLSLKDSEDWKKTTPEMKRIQDEWKKIGLVPKKEADPLWKAFKDACNHYFDRLHAGKNQAQKEEYENFEKKKAYLEQLKNFPLSGDAEKDLEALKKVIAAWKQYGRVPHNKKHINAKFDRVIKELSKRIGLSPQQSELLKYTDKVQQLTHVEDPQALYKERTFIKRKIEESKTEIRQLENNLQFFSNASESSPLVQEVINNINKQKEVLETWKAKLKKLSSLENKRNKTTDKHAEEE